MLAFKEIPRINPKFSGRSIPWLSGEFLFNDGWHRWSGRFSTENLVTTDSANVAKHVFNVDLTAIGSERVFAFFNRFSRTICPGPIGASRAGFPL